MKPQQIVASCCALAALAGNAALAATTIHDASNFDTLGDNLSGLVLADDFQVASAVSPTTASVWLLETTDSLPGSFDGFSGTLGWAIYASVGNYPSGAPLAVGSDFAPSLTDVGDVSGSFDVFRADIDLAGSLSSGSLALGAGTYWFALHEGAYLSSDDGSEIRWLHSLDTIAGTRPRLDFNETAPGNAWIDLGVDTDYALRIAVVPEPSGLALAALGLVGAALTFRRRRHTSQSTS